MCVSQTHRKLEVGVQTPKMTYSIIFLVTFCFPQLLTLPPNDRLLAINSLSGAHTENALYSSGHLGNFTTFSHQIMISKLAQCSLEFCRNKTLTILWTHKSVELLPRLEDMHSSPKSVCSPDTKRHWVQASRL